MSVHVMADVFRLSEATMGARLVLLVLADTASEDGVCWPLQETIAERTKLTVRQVKRTLVTLSDLGEVEVQQAQRGRRRVNVYRVLVGERAEVDYDRMPFDLIEPFTGGQYVTQSAEDEVTSTTPTGGHPQQVAPLIEEPSKEPSEKTLAAVPAATAYDPLKGMKISGRNLPWDALVEVTQADEKVEAGKIAKALQRIRLFVAPGFSPQAVDQAPDHCEYQIAQQIRARARLYRQRWPNMELTPTALASNWARVTTAPPGGTPDTALDAAQRGIDAARRTA